MNCENIKMKNNFLKPKTYTLNLKIKWFAFGKMDK